MQSQQEQEILNYVVRNMLWLLKRPLFTPTNPETLGQFLIENLSRLKMKNTVHFVLPGIFLISPFQQELAFHSIPYNVNYKLISDWNWNQIKQPYYT